MSARIRVLIGAVCCAFSAAAPLHASLMHASRVEHFSQGLQANGLPVAPERSDPSKSLGAPENGDFMNFVSIGFEGVIVLGFDQAFSDYVQIVETTYNNPAMYPEACEVFVGVGTSWDTAAYYSLGIHQNTEDDVLMMLGDTNAISGTSSYNYLKIVDHSNRSLLPSDADGFDVDGVSTFVTVPAPAGGAMALLSLASIGARRTRRTAK